MVNNSFNIKKTKYYPSLQIIAPNINYIFYKEQQSNLVILNSDILFS